MPHEPAVFLFAYGTLQQSRVQRTVFGREITGDADRLRGYVLVPPGRGWKYPNIAASSEAMAEVAGVVYQISEEELAGTDKYEGSEYSRILVTLESGTVAWVYLIH